MGCCRAGLGYQAISGNAQLNKAKSEAISGVKPAQPAPPSFQTLQSPCYQIDISGDYIPFVIKGNKLYIFPKPDQMEEASAFIQTCSSDRARKIQELITKAYGKLSALQVLVQDKKFTLSFIKSQVQ